jgi:hypothetical protein
MIELLMVIAIIGILASILLVAISSSQAKSRHAACLSNLHQIGLGFTGFTLDHEGKYPMDLPERIGGSLEYNREMLITNTGLSRAYQHFRALSNEVPNVKVMSCPADRRHRQARDYAAFSNTNLSYWVNPSAQPHATLLMLAGDWNVTATAPNPEKLEQIDFTREVHRRKGSVVFADGRVEITRTIAYRPPSYLTPNTTIAAQSSPLVTQKKGSARVKTRSVPPLLKSPPASQPNPTISANGASIQETASSTNITSSTNAVEPGPFSSEVRIKSTSRRISKSADTLTAGRPNPSSSSPTPRRRSTQSGGTESDEPWDTSGFRVFKFLAVASYLISLLWAIVALLFLYLRSRLNQRRQEAEINR